MDDISRKFCENFKFWYDKNYHGKQKEFAKELWEFIKKTGVNEKALRVGDKQISNVIHGRRCSGEQWRRYVAKFINISYEKMIGIGNNHVKLNNNFECVSENILSYDTEINALINKTRTVLESDTPWSDSLKSNIELFHNGFKTEQLDRRKKHSPEKIPPDTGDRRRVG